MLPLVKGHRNKELFVTCAKTRINLERDPKNIKVLVRDSQIIKIMARGTQTRMYFVGEPSDLLALVHGLENIPY